jgi:hypothetical protein
VRPNQSVNILQLIALLSFIPLRLPIIQPALPSDKTFPAHAHGKPINYQAI